jgi:hypothetical protein
MDRPGPRSAAQWKESRTLAPNCSGKRARSVPTSRLPNWDAGGPATLTQTAHSTLAQNSTSAHTLPQPARQPAVSSAAGPPARVRADGTRDPRRRYDRTRHGAGDPVESAPPGGSIDPRLPQNGRRPKPLWPTPTTYARRRREPVCLPSRGGKNATVRVRAGSTTRA